MALHAYRVFPENSPSTLKIIGDIQTVLNGAVKDASLQDIPLGTISFALGAGTFSDVSKIGETLILDHEAFVCFMENGLKTMRSKRALKSPFLLTLEENTPSKLFSYSSSSSISLEDMYLSLGQDCHAFAIVGSAHFLNLQTTYLKKAPIFSEPINEFSDKYWAETENFQGSYGYFFGAAVMQKDGNFFPEEILRKAFYSNPKQSSKKGLMSHTHVVLLKEKIDLEALKKAPRFPSSMQKEGITGARHLLTQSIIKEGVFAFYPIKELKDFFQGAPSE